MCRRGESYCSEFNEHWRTCVACGAKRCENFDKDCGFYEGASSLPCNNCAALLCGDCNVHVYHCGMCNTCHVNNLAVDTRIAWKKEIYKMSELRL